ncbi:hypothetical protein MPSEU_000942500 [Mayamaea pseudoterrestris]|nr:hypothetical protein MPSEU_000942500 [Mayamaea pseudoterrestris]
MRRHGSFFLLTVWYLTMRLDPCMGLMPRKTVRRLIVNQPAIDNSNDDSYHEVEVASGTTGRFHFQSDCRKQREELPLLSSARRHFVLQLLYASLLPQVSFAREPIQLEYCLVSLLRALGMFRAIATELGNTSNGSFKLNTYLEARAGAKALLTGKLGGGGTITKRVYALSSLRFVECLATLQQQYKDLPILASSSPTSTRSAPTADITRDLVEAIAELVEFDGLDSLTDPSPRSALTLAQYTDQKAVFVRRCLVEKVLPLGERILQYYKDMPAMETAKRYMQQYYADE